MQATGTAAAPCAAKARFTADRNASLTMTRIVRLSAAVGESWWGSVPSAARFN